MTIHFIYFIYITVFIYKPSFQLSLPFTRSYYPSFTPHSPFTPLFNNYISVDICLGTPKQCLPLNLELNVFPIWIISSTSQNKTELQKSFNSNTSTSHHLKSHIKIIFNYDKFETAYLSYEDFSIGDISDIKDVYFLLTEQFSEIPINSGVIGLDLQNRVYSDTPGSNLIEQLKKRKLIDSYCVSFVYDNRVGNEVKDYETGKLLIGEYPHTTIPQLQSKKLVFEKVVSVGSTLKWGIDVDKLLGNNNEIITEKIKVGFSIELGLNIGNVIYHEYIFNHFFQRMVNSELCSKVMFKKFFFSYKCNSNTDLNEFPPLKFKFGLNEVVFDKNDLFLRADGGFVFMIAFPGKDYVTPLFDWVFGAPFFKKNYVVLDMDKKLVGFYVDGNAAVIENRSVSRYIVGFGFAVAGVIGMGMIFLWKRRKVLRKRKMYFKMKEHINNKGMIG